MIFNLSIYAPASDPEKVTLTLTGEGEKTNCYIEIDGEKYYTAQTIQVAKGTNVYCFISKTVIANTHELLFNGKSVGANVMVGGMSGDEYYYSANNATINFEYAVFDTIRLTITES